MKWNKSQMSINDCRHKVIDHSNDAAGGRIPETDPRTIMLSDILHPRRPRVPSTKDWRPRVHKEFDRENRFHVCDDGCKHYEWGEMINKKIRDCTVAAPGHMIQTWTANADNHEFTISDSSILEAYCQLTGFDPATMDPKDSRGSSCLNALKLWRNSGIGGHKIHSFVGLRPGNVDDVREAIFLFGSAYVCLGLPQIAIKQAVWGLGGEPGADENPNSWTSHAVCAVGFDEDELTVITWGFEKRLTWDFFRKYSDEAYAVLSQEWIADDGKAPNHIDAKKLEARLEAISM